MSVIIDLIVIAIIAFVVWRSATRGFVRTIIELVGYILSAVVAFTVAGAVADVVYEKSVRPAVVAEIEKRANSESKSKNGTAVAEDVWEGLPSFIVSIADSAGVTKESFASEVDESIESNINKAAITVTDKVIQPIVINMIRVILASIIFILLMILVRILAKMMNRLFEVPVLGTFNSVFGGILGFAKGIVIVFVLATIIGVALPLFDDKIFGITPHVIDNTYIFKAIYNFKPFSS